MYIVIGWNSFWGFWELSSEELWNENTSSWHSPEEETEEVAASGASVWFQLEHVHDSLNTMVLKKTYQNFVADYIYRLWKHKNVNYMIFESRRYENIKMRAIWYIDITAWAEYVDHVYLTCFYVPGILYSSCKYLYYYGFCMVAEWN